MGEHRFPMQQELLDMYGPAITPLYYCSILAAIPKVWKQTIKYENLEEELDIDLATDRWQQHAVRENCTVSKLMYWDLVTHKFPLSKALDTIWNFELGINMSAEEMWEIFAKFLWSVKPTKLRNFQYRILTHSLTTNIKRNKWNSAISPECTFCKKEKETIFHLLVACEKVQVLWVVLTKIIKYYFHMNVLLTPQMILFNSFSGLMKDIITFLVIVLKQYIYASKCFEELPTFPKYMAKLSYWYLIDKHIAYDTSKVVKFKKKWKDLF